MCEAPLLKGFRTGEVKVSPGLFLCTQVGHMKGSRVVHGQRGELRQPGGGPSPAWVGRVLGGLTR